MFNDTVYKNLLVDLLHSPTEDQDHIKFEILNLCLSFSGDEDFTCANDEYVKAELNWYNTMSRNIHTNDRIARNPIWSKICSKDGTINSNYGWCIFSKENSSQYNEAMKQLANDLYTKHCVMIYSRPTINKEWNDGVNANSDMICTIYVSVNVRKHHGKYYMTYTVHMRSCDAWFGLRNDLMWHKFILDKMKFEIEALHNIVIEKSSITWIADSIHLYDFEVENVKKFLELK